MRRLLGYGRFLLVAMSAGVSAQPSMPDTPAGELLSSWLAAVNGGDEERSAWLDAYDSRHTRRSLQALRRETGGLDLVRIHESKLFSIEYVVRERANDSLAFGRFAVDNADTPRVTQSVMREMPPGWEFAGFSIGLHQRRDVIREARKVIQKHYVLRREGKHMLGALFRFDSWGWYNGLTDGRLLADVLTRQLRTLSGDQHIRVSFNPARVAGRFEEAEASVRASYRRRLENVNCGFERAERWESGIGYVRLSFFADSAICGRTAARVMNRLAGVDSVIVDLRGNIGGDPRMVQLLSSYFFDRPTHLNSIWTRASDETEEIWTFGGLPGASLEDVPLFVLMSRSSFSSAEDFAYSLQTLGRATVVGEVSAGAAHLVRTERLTEQFTIVIPVARPVNPITGTNWEDTGVIPDVPVPAKDALETARRIAAAAESAT